MGGGAGGKNGPMSFGKSKAKMLSEDQIKVRTNHKYATRNGSAQTFEFCRVF
jgi:ATP-dependent Zn protease